jgi:FHA domain
MAESKTPSLTVLGGPLAGTQCSLPEDGTFTIGSAPGSSLYLDLPGVSPYHARVVVAGTRVTVHDTGSSRTVHVNDNALDREGTELRNGDILWLGVPGEEDVVMMQCILPRRAPAPAPVAPPEPAEPPAEAAEPTPDIETVALWAHERKAEAASAHVAAADPTAAADDAPPPPDVVEAAPAHLPAFIDDFESETVAQTAAERAPVDETYRLDSTETVAEVPEEVAPTLLMGSADEVEPGFVEPLPSEQDFESYQTIPADAEPVVEAAAVPEAPAAEPVAAPVAAKPAEPARPRPPAAPRPATTRPLPPSVSQRTRRAPARPTEPGQAAEGAVAAPKAARSGPPMLVIGGAIGVLVLVAGGYFAWRAMSQSAGPPAPAPTPVARASEPPPAPVATPEPAAATPAPVESATPEPVATPTPVVSSTPTPPAAATPTPRPTATPRATPTPAAAATPPPAPTGPSPAQQAAGLIGQAEAALGARQYDAAISHLDGALRLDPGNARATSLRADAAQRRDLARRKFVAGRTVVDSEKTRKDKARGLVGFDADEKAPDFTGRIEFEMTPAGAVEANDAWTLRVFVVNQGQKAIRVQGLALGAAVNGTGGAAPVAANVREIAPQQRVQVAETSGTWHDGTTSWVAQATLTAPKNETLSNTLTWR